MKKVAVLAVLTALSGCASDSETMQIVSSSSEEIYTAEQLHTMERIQEAKVPQPVVQPPKIEKTVAVAPVAVPVKRTVTPIPEQKKQVTPKPVDKPKPKPVYKPAATDPEGYTIQVLALSHNKGFRPYMNKLPSNQPVWMNKKQLQGVPWYTMLFGHYRTREEAKRALNALPQDVKDYGPFIRSFSEIKTSPTPKLTKLK
ncbi:DamX-related protein [Photobacterium marinum]|uniref:DamX-related protein n=1 Tax=Photobacterium marinum TaxID=1056511 RepID=L8JC03_9GAMM|nr:SPOR domain-containing protein [Photobacterium marinum]ELR65773.1 DamX-related protein [Photobacterium marinum]